MSDIKTLYAWVLDKNCQGEAAVPSITMHGHLIPMYAQTSRLAQKLKPFAIEAAKQDNTTVRLLRFDFAEEIECYESN